VDTLAWAAIGSCGIGSLGLRSGAGTETGAFVWR